jgi:hypothetical protein
VITLPSGLPCSPVNTLRRQRSLRFLPSRQFADSWAAFEGHASIWRLSVMNVMVLAVMVCQVLRAGHDSIRCLDCSRRY